MPALPEDEGDGDKAARGAEGARPLELPECEGLPRQMLESGLLSEHVFARMDFLWKASHCLRVLSPAASRVYSDQLLKLFAEHGREVSGWGGLPDCVADSMCSTCGGVFAPGINCRVRVRHRSLASPGAKSKRSKKSTTAAATTSAAAGRKGPHKYRNEVVVTCLLCGGVTTRGGTERRAHHRRRQRRGGGGGLEAAVEPAGRNGRSRIPTNLRGNFIPMGASSSSSSRGTDPFPSAASTSSKKKKRKLAGLPEGVPSPKIDGGLRGRGGEGRSGDGGNSKPSGGGEISRGFLPVPATTGGISVSGRSSGDSYCGRSDYGAARGGGCVGQAAAARTSGSEPAAAPREAPSLLEKIRKDAKRKRRQGAAGVAATASAAASGAGAGVGTGGTKR